MAFLFRPKSDVFRGMGSGATQEDPRDKNHLSTREEINDMLKNTLQQQGTYLNEEFDDRNKLINVLGLDKPQ